MGMFVQLSEDSDFFTGLCVVRRDRFPYLS